MAHRPLTSQQNIYNVARMSSAYTQMVHNQDTKIIPCDFQVHAPFLDPWDILYGCAAVDKILVKIYGVARSLCDSW